VQTLSGERLKFPATKKQQMGLVQNASLTVKKNLKTSKDKASLILNNVEF